MFVRFVVGNERERYWLLTGVITEARILRDDGRLEAYRCRRWKRRMSG